MTSNSQLQQKNIELRYENDNLRDLRWALLADNRRLEAERGALETANDLLVQAIDAVTAERDEARAWAQRMMRERDEARRLLDEMKNRYTYTYRFMWDVPKPGFWWWLK